MHKEWDLHIRTFKAKEQYVSSFTLTLIFWDRHLSKERVEKTIACRINNT